VPADSRRSRHTPLVDRESGLVRPLIPILRVVAGRDVLRFVVLQTGAAMEFGRDADCALSLTDASVSRRHARLQAAEGGVFAVEDLDSHNGVFVNGARQQTARLQPGDLLELGSVPLRFEPPCYSSAA
jgi:pSer/pThr/pTyr-binding forkhead associated (FHA) protein